MMEPATAIFSPDVTVGSAIESIRELVKTQLITYAWILEADGKLVGDWKNGEKIAQEGRGKQYSDDPAGPVGGNCYACHQLTKEEVSYGTIGPPLYQFGKVRGYTDEMRKYAYGKVYNAEAYSACTHMPRQSVPRSAARRICRACFPGAPRSLRTAFQAAIKEREHGRQSRPLPMTGLQNRGCGVATGTTSCPAVSAQAPRPAGLRS